MAARSSISLLLLTTMLASGLGFGPPAAAAVAGEVIAAANATTGRTVIFSAADGGQRSELRCGGNLSNRFPNGTHYFAFAKEIAPGRAELYAVDEDCVSEVRLTSDPYLNVRGWAIAWSPSGNRIAFYATQTNLLGAVVAEGLFVGLVQRDLAGRPQSLAATRFAFPMLPSAAVSWSGDERRVTFGQELPSDKYLGGTQGDVLVGNVDTGEVVNLTNSEVGEYHPAFSPTVDRIAYVTKTSKSGNYRNDIFVLDPTTGALSQLTDRSNASAMQIAHPSYSPDGKNIAFSGWPTSGHGANIYRVAADGLGKAIDLTSSSADIHYVPQWRK